MPFRYSGRRFVCGPREGFVQKRVFSDGYLPGGAALLCFAQHYR